MWLSFWRSFREILSCLDYHHSWLNRLSLWISVGQTFCGWLGGSSATPWNIRLLETFLSRTDLCCRWLTSRSYCRLCCGTWKMFSWYQHPTSQFYLSFYLFGFSSLEIASSPSLESKRFRPHGHSSAWVFRLIYLLLSWQEIKSFQKKGSRVDLEILVESY